MYAIGRGEPGLSQRVRYVRVPKEKRDDCSLDASIAAVCRARNNTSIACGTAPDLTLPPANRTPSTYGSRTSRSLGTARGTPFVVIGVYHCPSGQ